MSTVHGIFGPRGSGKTVYAGSLINPQDLTIVFDPNHESEWAKVADECVIGKPRTLATRMNEETSGVILYRPSPWDESSEETPLQWPATLAFLRGKCTLIIDEAHLFLSAGWMPRVMVQCVRIGRHRELSIIYISQSWAAVSRAITSNSQQFTLFKMIEPRDLYGIEERFGRAARDRCRTLKQYEHETFQATNTFTAEEDVRDGNLFDRNDTRGDGDN